MPMTRCELLILYFFAALLCAAISMRIPPAHYPTGYQSSRSLYHKSDTSMTMAMESEESVTDGTIMYSIEEQHSHDEPHAPITRVITDIDDTVKSSGGKKIFGIPLGGVDTQFKRGEFYPGVFQFALELSRHKVAPHVELASDGKSKAKQNRPPIKLIKQLANAHHCAGTENSKLSQSIDAVKTVVGKSATTVTRVIPARVGVLTARAKEFKFALALKPNDRLCSAFREAGRKNGFGSDWGIGSVYYGSAAEWVVTSWKGLRKFENFEMMMEKDRVATDGRGDQYIFCGDTGEKDEQAGDYIASKYPDSLRAVFLHVVSENPDLSEIEVPEDRTVGNVPIFYFRTYVGAASKAVKNQLMTIGGLKRVIDQAQVDMALKEEKHMHPFVRAEISSDITEARSLVDSVEQEIMFLRMNKKAASLK